MFFPESELAQSKRPESNIPKCGLCKLYKQCESPKMEPFGKGRRKILVVGEAPGAEEDEQGRPFIGRAGQELKAAMREAGIELDKDCWLTNSLICRPPKNATPTSDQISYCKPNLTKTIKRLKPRVIIPVGRSAVEAVLSGIWTESFGALNRWVGWQIPCRDLNVWITPTYHPSYILRETSGDRKRSPVRDIFVKHLKAARKLEDYPYTKPRNLKDSIKIIMDSSEILRHLNKFIVNGGTTAFDIETNMLKPEDTKATIRSAAICWKGTETIAFPMLKPDVIHAFKTYLRSRSDKIAHNAKFEDRWCRAKLVPVRNWLWDTMNMAHVHDNRKEICSLSFQSMVWLGVAPYGQHISPMLASPDSYGENQISKIDWKKLLLYNGMDALTTYMLAEKQRQVMMVKFT